MRDLTQHLTTRADDNHAPPVSEFPEGHSAISGRFSGCQAPVRFFALLRIKPHTPLLVRAPVNSFEFQPCGRTPRQLKPSRPPSPLVFLPISTHFTATPGIPPTSTSLKLCSFNCNLWVEPIDFTADLQSRLRTLYTQ